MMVSVEWLGYQTSLRSFCKLERPTGKIEQRGASVLMQALLCHRDLSCLKPRVHVTALVCP